jgi:hypothetical protein
MVLTYLLCLTKLLNEGSGIPFPFPRSNGNYFCEWRFMSPQRHMHTFAVLPPVPCKITQIPIPEESAAVAGFFTNKRHAMCSPIKGVMGRRRSLWVSGDLEV